MVLLYCSKFKIDIFEDELKNSWNTFDDFEIFERKHSQNIREYVAYFDLYYQT